MSRISPRLAPTQVRCGAPTRGVSRWMRVTSWCVRVRVEPSAPYVTDTNRGARGARRSTERHSVASTAASPGGKNSKDTFIARASWFIPVRRSRSTDASLLPSCRARRPARPVRRQHGHRGQHVLAIGLDGTHALARQAGLAEDPAQPGERMLHHPLAGALEGVVTLEEQDASRGRECASARCEQRAERLVGSTQTVEQDDIESASEASEVTWPERIATCGEEHAAAQAPALSGCPRKLRGPPGV